MKKDKNKLLTGFTIIELIVVIAIIAVLAAVVAVNVASYIAKGKDAAIKGNLNSLLVNSSVWFDTQNPPVYTGFSADNNNGCGTTSPIRAAITGDGSTLVCDESATAWYGCAQEVVDSSKYFCVDSRGVKKETIGDCADTFAGQVCP